MFQATHAPSALPPPKKKKLNKKHNKLSVDTKNHSYFTISREYDIYIYTWAPDIYIIPLFHVVVNICIKKKIYTQGRDKILEFDVCVLIFLRPRVKSNVLLIAPPSPIKVLQKNSGTQESSTNLTLQGSEIQTSTR